MKKQPLLGHLAANAKKSMLALGFLASFASTGCTSQEPTTVYQQIIQNIVNQETKGIDIQAIDKRTSEYLKLLDEKGAFTDIDYTSRAQTGWKPMDHVSRLKEMVVSYITPESKYHGDRQLHATLVNMFNYWYDANPTSTNWWFHEIGWAQRMGLSLSLMRAGEQQLPDSTETKILDRMKKVSKGPDQKGSQGTGANKMDIALQWIYRTCLQEDEANLKFAIEQFFYPIKYNEKQGLQSDYSYLQHGQQLYTGGYGASVLNGFLKVAFYLENTPYTDKEKNNLISKFVRYGNIPGIRGKYMLYNLLGRGIARENDTDRSSMAHGIEKLMQLDPANAETYQASIKRLKEEVPANYGIVPFHRHFWRSDHTIHQRPEYTMDVRTASTRTARCENGNKENMLGYFLTEGGTGIVRRGDEYANVFVSWDWSHIPGTTTPAVKVIPVPHAWEHTGQSTFTGGVSDDVYGVTTYQMKDNEFGVNTSGKKSWFFFDKEVVCMGSDIKSTNKYPVHTTVNQCLSNGKISFLTKGGASESTLTKESQTFSNLLCLTHDSISYYFPEGGNLSVSNLTQTGRWKDLSRHLSDAPVSQDIFKLWFNHGVRPSNGKYVYYVVPNTASAKEAAESLDHLITVNNEKIQAVYNQTANIVGVVFHQAGTIKLDQIEVSASAPCIAMFTQVNTENVKAYVADPSYVLPSVTLSITTPQLGEKKVVDCTFKTDLHFAGSTHCFEISKANVAAK